MEPDALRVLIRQKHTDGQLTRLHSQGNACHICEEPIPESELVTGALFRKGNGSVLRMHVRCFGAWMKGLGGSPRHPPSGS